MTGQSTASPPADLSSLADLLLGQFDEIYIVNLPNRTDRKREVRRQLSRIGIDPDGPKIRFFEAIRPDDRGHWPTIGARGCFLSHLGVLRHAVEQNHDAILILEDDADWSDSFRAVGVNTMSEIAGTAWSFIHGGNRPGKGHPSLHVLSPEKPLLLAHCIALKGQVIGKLANYLAAMVERAPGDPRGGPMHVDGAYNWFRKDHPELLAFVAVPCIAQQRPSRTDIHDLSWSDRTPILREVKGVLRGPFRKAMRIFSSR